MSMKKRNRPTNQWLIFSSLALQIGIIIFVCVRLGEYLDASLSPIVSAKLIWYVVDGVEHIDLVRCSKVVRLFDMYYDKYGKGAVQKIDFGYGTVNPKLWGNKPKKDKKRK